MEGHPFAAALSSTYFRLVARAICLKKIRVSLRRGISTRQRLCHASREDYNREG